jgi:hypothetical protein
LGVVAFEQFRDATAVRLNDQRQAEERALVRPVA